MIDKKIFAKILIVFLLTNFFKVQAQENIDSYTKKYPSDDEIILSQTETMNISIEKDKLKIYSDNYEESYIIKDIATTRSSIGRVPYSSFQQIEDLKAYTLVPNSSKKFKKIDAINFRNVPDKHSRTFHNDLMIKEFDYPQLALGTKKMMEYKMNFPEPRVISGAVFLDNEPVVYKEFKIIADKDVELGYKVFNNQNQKIQFSKEEKNGKNIYRWFANDVQKFNFEEKQPNALYYAPLVEIYIKNYTDDQGKKVNVLNSLDNLHQLYQGYVKDVDENPSEELKKTVNSLKALHTEELDQVKEIYYWVKNNIKYIAFEDGYGGFIPRKANDIFTKRYGDCKDMSAIIYTMLKCAGIKTAYLTWIGSREKPFTYEEIPTMMVDDHMIVTYQKDGKNYFLDGTARETPFGYPSFFIQGKQAMVHKGTDLYELVKVPIVEPEKNVKKDDVVLEIKDGKILGKAKSTFTGFERDLFLEKLQDQSGFDKTAFLKNELELGNDKFYIEKYDIANQQDRDKNLEVTYDFNLDNYVISTSDEIFVNLALDKLQDLKTLDEKRQFPYEIDNAFHYQAKVTLKVPQNYKVSYIPESENYAGEKFSYQISYSQKSDSVEMDLDVEVNYIMLQTSDIKKWNEFVNKLKDKISESMSLQKKNTK